MRGALLLFCLTGCHLMFPLDDDEKPGVDGSVDLSNPTLSTIVETQAIAGEANQLVVTVVGTPSTRIAYDLQLDQGAPDRVDTQQLDLDGDGRGSAMHGWTPGQLGRAAIDARVDYDLTLASPGAVHVDAEVFERFGITVGDEDSLNPLAANVLVAVPIVLPGPARVERLSIHVRASITGTQGLLGLYAGTSSLAPETLVTQTTPFDIEPSAAIVLELPTPQAQQPGVIDVQLNYWVAFIANQPVELPERARNPPAIPQADVGVFFLPDSFPVTNNVFPKAIAVGAMLGPPLN